MDDGMSCIGKKRFMYVVPMVYKDTGKFKSLLHSKTVEKDIVRIKKYDKYVKGVRYNEIIEAREMCLESLNKKIPKIMKKNFLPVKRGFIPVKKKKKEQQWTDIVFLIDASNTYYW